MSDERLRELERRWKASGADEDEAAWVRALVDAGQLAPDEAVELVFTELERSGGEDSEYLCAALEMRSPDGTILLEPKCVARDGTAGYWEMPYRDWCEASLKRIGKQYVVRFVLYERGHNMNYERETFHSSSDGGKTWDKAERLPQQMLERLARKKPLARITLET